jgi:hypothetical protein
MAEWDTAYINDLPDSAFACIDAGGEKDEQGKTVPRSKRHYPHHNAGGALDLPHLRNALSRVAQDATATCGVGHLQSHAEEAGVGETKTIAAVKFADGSKDIIEGIGIPFGGPFAGKDIHGDDFGPDTDFCLDWFEKRPLLYEHGTDAKLQHSKIGTVISHEERDDGIWVQAQLDTASRYKKAVEKLIERQALYFSGGALDYLIKGSKSDPKHATRWPWVELSLTPKPANPGQPTVYSVKAVDALEHFDNAQIEMPAAVKGALEALDEWAIEQTPSTPEPTWDAEADLVLGRMKAWVDWTENRVEMRSVAGRKFGRELSKANIEKLREMHRMLGELLERADKPTEDEERAEAAKAAFAEYLRIEADLLTA